jgi:hypothetical protein
VRIEPKRPRWSIARWKRLGEDFVDGFLGAGQLIGTV